MGKFEEALVAHQLCKMEFDILEEEYSKAKDKIYRKLRTTGDSLANLCTHKKTTHHSSWNYHNNVDDSYDQCDICGKHRSYGTWN